MAKQSPFEWIIEKLNDDNKIESIDILSENLLQISKKDNSSFTVTKTNLNRFEVNDIIAILINQNANFILHTSKEPFINGDVFDYLNSKKIVLGGFGDLMRAVKQHNYWPYLPPDVYFITRGLEQHTKVSKVKRLDNKRYEISRHNLETVIIIALNDYDLGIESIRSAVSEFAKFDAILKSNPNGSITTSAIQLADSREIKTFKWGELMGKLNLKWNWNQYKKN